jgi:hypothetical protein
MNWRFDHAVIAVRDLLVATQQFQRLGFAVQPGGRHSSGGTHNAIVRFGLDYLELMAVVDAEAAAVDPTASALMQFVQVHEGGLVGFALACDDVERLVEPLRAHHTLGPIAMSRTRPDGRELAWKLLLPGGMPWCRPWPFLIEWATPDESRLRWDGSVEHPNGARAVVALDLAARDVGTARTLLGADLGLEQTADGFRAGACCVRVVAADASDPSDAAEGPRAVHIAVVDLARARDTLSAAGVQFEARDRALRIHPDDACGAVLHFDSSR